MNILLYYTYIYLIYYISYILLIYCILYIINILYIYIYIYIYIERRSWLTWLVQSKKNSE